MADALVTVHVYFLFVASSSAWSRLVTPGP
jgi:hypothetical protein